MAYLQVYAGPASAWLLDVQSDLIDVVSTRVVIPLVPIESAPPPAKRLNPVFEIGDTRAVLVTESLAAVPANLLTTPVADLSHSRDEVTAALDLLLHGF